MSKNRNIIEGRILSFDKSPFIKDFDFSSLKIEKKRIFIIDGIIDTPRVRQNYVLAEDELLMSPDDIAESYWHLIQQPKSSWAFEIAVRPHTEAFFE